MTSSTRLIIDGHSSAVGYHLANCPQGSWLQQDAEDYSFTLIAGAHFLRDIAQHVVEADRGSVQALGVREVALVRGPEFQYASRPRRQFQVQGTGSIPALGTEWVQIPCLRAKGEARKFFTPHAIQMDPPTAADPTGKDVLVHWLAHPSLGETPDSCRVQPSKCQYHVQSGTRNDMASQRLAQPGCARLLVTSLSEQSGAHRIRKGLSYESTTVDVLRMIRGTRNLPELSAALLGPGFDLKRESEVPHLCLVFRINSAAVLYYRFTRTAKRSRDREAAYLIFRRDRAAPVDIPGRLRMHGYTSFLAAHLGAHAYLRQRQDESDETHETLDGWVRRAITQAILRQAALYEGGLFHLLFKPADEGRTFVPIEDANWGARPNWFAYLDALRKNWEEAQRPANAVHEVDVGIFPAVSHRTQWFIAQDLLWKQSDGGTPASQGADAWTAADSFRDHAVDWLSGSKAPENDIPMVQIGKLKLIDRREIEDFLAIHNALAHYDSRRGAPPLNIAVFGPPGSGKSFGVSQVAKHLSDNDGAFAAKELKFNVSQFAGVADLIGALHEVRDECLRGKVPLVFFDEFDSAFEGRPFGWLKYFLAPMQDGEFKDGTTTHRLGPCVLVFAGGVNRSFEEMNGRLRNPSFCEAKGIDFISRLRGHLNICGVNKPDDENDQGRYILRRAVFIREKLMEIFGDKGAMPPKALMTPQVARAFCSVERFKHGLRSIEAILQMCDLRPGAQLGPSDFPAKAQLEMHVDAAEFLDCLIAPPPGRHPST